MANNANGYASDPNNASLGNPATPQSGAGGNMSDFPSPPAPQPGPSFPPPAAGGSLGPRRLTSGVALSGERYTIERLVAAGGMGAVYLAQDTRFERPCAVKEMLDTFQGEAERDQAVEWFRREATLLLELNHPCIPRVRDFFIEEGRHYLVMDFIEGRTLADVLEKEGTIAGLNGARGVSEQRVRSWARQLCSVLDYLHQQSPPIIFRDLKPSNIMLTKKDEIKLIDFGIARTFQSQRQSTIIMTIGYAPPEQLHGMPEPRSDIYALGATMHRMLTHHDAANNKPNIFSFPPIRTLRPDLSPAFEQVLAKALAPQLEQRWSSAAEMERAIINLPAYNGSISSVSNPGIVNVSSPGLGVVTPSGPQQPISGPGVSGTTGPAGYYLMTAQNLIRAGNLTEAFKVMEQAFQLEPNNALTHKLYGRLFSLRRPPIVDKAIEGYVRSIQLDSNDAEAHKLYGDALLFLRRQPAQAIQAYSEAARRNPRDVEARQLLARCYEETHQFEPALREYQEAGHLAPKNPGIHYSVGQLAMRLGQFHLAERAFVQVLTINPADHQTRFLLSQVYEREQKWQEAHKQCTYVIQAEPNNTQARAMQARLQAYLKR